MEGNNQKLGDTLETLNNSIKNKDMETALKAFKLIKQNKYSLFIEVDKKLDKNSYNSVTLPINDENIYKNDD